MVNLDAALFHHFLELPIADRIRHISTDTPQDHITFKMAALELGHPLALFPAIILQASATQNLRWNPARRAATNIRVVGVDDWAWRNGWDHHRRLGAAGGTRPFAGSFREHDGGLAQAASGHRDHQPRSPRLVRPGRAERRAASRKSPIVFIFCRTCVRPFGCNSVAWPGRPHALCCRRTVTPTRRQLRAACGINTGAPSIAASPE